MDTELGTEIEIKGDGIILKQLKESDAFMIYRNINDKSVLRYLTTSYPYEPKKAYIFIRKSLIKIKRKIGYDLGIFVQGTGELVGIISLMKINDNYKNAELGYWLGRDYWRIGIMNRAVNLILGFAFKELSLMRVQAKVMHPNDASRKLLEKSGFKFEGRMRKSCYKNNQWYDHLLYSMLSQEFLELYSCSSMILTSIYNRK